MSLVPSNRTCPRTKLRRLALWARLELWEPSPCAWHTVMKARAIPLERIMEKSKSISSSLCLDAYRCMGRASPSALVTTLEHRMWGNLWATWSRMIMWKYVCNLIPKTTCIFFPFFILVLGLLEIAGARFEWPPGETQMGELQVSTVSAASEKGANPSPRCSPIPSPRTPTAAFHRRAWMSILTEVKSKASIWSWSKSSNFA